MRKYFHIIILIFSGFAGGAFAQSLGGAISQAGVTFLNVIFGPIQATPPLAGGMLGTNAVGITNGSLNIWNPLLYGQGGAAAGACILTNADGAYPGATGTTTQCRINGATTASPTSFAASPSSRDNVGLLISNVGNPPLFGSLNGTFTATAFVPTTPLTAPQLLNMRVGMAIDTNDATPYSATVTGWAANGTSVTVQGWYLQGTLVQGTPAGTAATISNVLHLFGENIYMRRGASASASRMSGVEYDIVNNSGVDDTGFQIAALPTPWDGGIDIASLGTNIASFGLITRGTFNSGITLNHTGLYGIYGAPWTRVAGGAPINFPLYTPANSSESCAAGSMEWDASFIYICTAANTWKRATLAGF